MAQFNCENDFGKLMFIIGHELVHIKYNDTPQMKKEAFRMFVNFIILFICCLYLIFITDYFNIKPMMYLLVFIEIFVGKVMSIMCDRRYLKQIAELRADRLGLEACGETIETFKIVMNQLGEDEEIVNWREGLLNWYLSLYEDIDEHPYSKTRIYEIERGKRWGWKEYIRYCWLVMWNKIKGKGWRL